MDRIFFRNGERALDTETLRAAPRSAGRQCCASLRADIWPRWLCGYRNATPQTGSWDADVLDGIGGYRSDGEVSCGLAIDGAFTYNRRRVDGPN